MFPRSVTQSGTVIINVDPHTKKVSDWPAIHFLPKFSTAYFFGSYVIVPLFPDIASFIQRNCTVWDYNMRQLQCLTNNVCAKYCCPFALYMDRGFTAKQFFGQFDGASGERQIIQAFVSPRVSGGGGGQCSSSIL